MILLLISFIAGVLSVLAPCVLPLLPVIVGQSVTGERSPRRAIVIVVSLGLSIVLFTLLLKASTVFINVPPSFWLWFSGGILITFGIVMMFPRLWDSLGIVALVNRSSNQLLATGYQKNSFWGDVIMGAALGPVFSSCSPTYFVVLATVLPASFAMGLLDLIAYAIGLSGFLLIIALLGQRLVDKLGVTIEPTGWFRRAIGILFVAVGVAILTGFEKKAEIWLLDHGFDITKIEQRLLEANPPRNESQMCAAGFCPGQVSVTELATTTEEIIAPGKAVADAKIAIQVTKKAAMYAKAPELVMPNAYINTDGKPITIGEFLGKKVVLIDIWTYSCINCQRTLPYLKAWHQKYKDQGLVIIGVHTPEFAFEKVQKNVQDAAMGFGLTYPIVLDNEYKTWNAFGNNYWPRKYLIDIDGYIVYDHAGEGQYEEAEEAIQAALAERAKRLGATDMADVGITAPSDAVAVQYGLVGSPETYFGAWRNDNFGNGTPGQIGIQTLTLPQSLAPNAFYLDGTWSFEREYVQNVTQSAKLHFRYQSKDVYFVASADKPVRIKVTRDGGKSLGAARGADVDQNGYATINEDRLYKLIEDSAYGAHTLEIEVEGQGLKAYTFTFG